jgi:hypothetical protein
MDISDKILLQQTISYEYVRSKIFCARVSIKTQEARDDVFSLSLSLSLCNSIYLLFAALF